MTSGRPTASATVRVSYEAHALVVDVTDDGRGTVTSLTGSGAGQGLIGMRERVEIYGGEFIAGPRPGGGYAVHAVLPVVNRDSEGTPAVEQRAVRS